MASAIRRERRRRRSLDFKIRRRELEHRRRGSDADCKVEAPTGILLDLVNGKLNAVAAFDQGKLYVTGNFELANNIGQLLFGG